MAAIKSSKRDYTNLTPHKLLKYLVNGRNALVLSALHRNPVTNKTSLAERNAEISTSVAARTVKKHREWGLVRNHPRRDQYEATAFGVLVLNNYQTLVNTLGQEGVDLISKSPNVIPILRQLDEKPASLDDLKTADSISAGRTAIYRCRTALENAGWVVRTQSLYEPSFTGRVAMIAYRSFAGSAVCIIEHREFLRTYDEDKHPAAALRSCADDERDGRSY